MSSGLTYAKPSNSVWSMDWITSLKQEERELQIMYASRTSHLRVIWSEVKRLCDKLWIEVWWITIRVNARFVRRSDLTTTKLCKRKHQFLSHYLMPPFLYYTLILLPLSLVHTNQFPVNSLVEGVVHNVREPSLRMAAKSLNRVLV